MPARTTFPALPTLGTPGTCTISSAPFARRPRAGRCSWRHFCCSAGVASPLGAQHRRPLPDHRGDAQRRITPILERAPHHQRRATDRPQHDGAHPTRGGHRGRRPARRPGRQGAEHGRQPHAQYRQRTGRARLGPRARSLDSAVHAREPVQHGAARGRLRGGEHVSQARVSDGEHAARELGGDVDQPRHPPADLRQGDGARPGPVHALRLRGLHGPDHEHRRHARQRHHDRLRRGHHRAARRSPPASAEPSASRGSSRSPASRSRPWWAF